ncbi:MAG: site-2 protease family protein [Alphaproteobacteria bacterium]|nr:site-2 protease family protein [Alphaproteobacteria bacterium]
MIINALISVVAIVISIVAHEVAHGFVACKLGDDTAKKAGRLTIKPWRHINWFGTLVLPLVLFLAKTGFVFGWAEPVPVNYAKLKSRRNIILTALAGSAANVILAIAAALLLQLWQWVPHNLVMGILGKFLLYMVFVNLILALFNLLPVPPLDGAKVLLLWDKNPYIRRYLQWEKYGLIAVVSIVFIIPAFMQACGIHFNPLADGLKTIAAYVASCII